MDLQTYLRVNGCANCSFDTRHQQQSHQEECSNFVLCLKQAELGQSYEQKESNIATVCYKCYKEGFDDGRKAGIQEVKRALEENLFGGKKLD